MSSDLNLVKWLDEPEEHDYPAAADYLLLLADAETVDTLVESLRAAPLVHKKAKDILRAAALPLLSPDNPDVRRDLTKILTGKALSPILLVQGDLAIGAPTQIADGYHRVCACYHTNEDIPIPTKLAPRHGLPVVAAHVPPTEKPKSKSKK